MAHPSTGPVTINIPLACLIFATYRGVVSPQFEQIEHKLRNKLNDILGDSPKLILHAEQKHIPRSMEEASSHPFETIPYHFVGYLSMISPWLVLNEKLF